jgi:protein gp37
MSANSKIEWTDHTFNPWEGCQKVSPGCDNCYAEARNARFGGGVAINWGPGAPRRRTSNSNWSQPYLWDVRAEAFWNMHGRRQRVFCASLADVFDSAVDDQWRDDLFELIRQTPSLDWLLLTKRIGNVKPMLYDMILRWKSLPDSPAHQMARRWARNDPPPNVWLGATIVNQQEADRDIPKLLTTPAAKRFLSMEPLLEPVNLGFCDCDHGSIPGPHGVGGVSCPKCGGTGGRLVDWVIVGGESGPGARPMHPLWPRDLRDQCEKAGVPFLFKQWGEWVGVKEPQHRGPADFIWNDYFSSRKVGKKAAGRLLDGRTWDGVPTP